MRELLDTNEHGNHINSSMILTMLMLMITKIITQTMGNNNNSSRSNSIDDDNDDETDYLQHLGYVMPPKKESFSFPMTMSEDQEHSSWSIV